MKPYVAGNSFLPFLTGNMEIADALFGMCQSPSHRGTHFYTDDATPVDKTWSSVNPLHVGELISSKGLSGTWTEEVIVSIPFTSGNSFLLTKMTDMFEGCSGCQSPSRRGTHFYPHPYFLLNLCGFPASISGVFSRQF